MNEIARPSTAASPFHRNRAIILSLFALMLATLSFSGTLDSLAASELDELIKETLGYLAISKGFNATVSILQTIELKIPFFSSVEIGQTLDPVNDAAERLSDALIWATGSLFLQSTLLKIVSGSVLGWGYLALGVMAATSLLLAQSDRARSALVTSLGVSHVALAQLQDFLVKTFIVATVVRFIVPIFATASLFVGQAVMAPEIEQHSRELVRLEGSLSEIGAQISEARDEVAKKQTDEGETATEDQTEDTVSDGEFEQASPSSALPEPLRAEDMQTLGEQKSQLEETLALLESEKDRLESERERLSDGVSEVQKSGWKSWIPKFSGDPDKMLGEASAEVKQVESEIERKKFQVACIDGSSAAADCESFLAERQREALGEFRIQVELEQKELQERLESLREEQNTNLAENSDEFDGEPSSGWRDKIAGTLPRLLGGDSSDEHEAIDSSADSPDTEIRSASTLAKQMTAELACTGRRIVGEHCDSPRADDYVQSALDRLKEELNNDLLNLRTELTSLQGERTRLMELARLTAERSRVESEIEESKKLTDRTESELECVERRMAGEDCDTIVDDGRQLISGTWTAAGNMVSSATEAAGKGLSSAGQVAGRVVSSVADATSKIGRGVLKGFNAMADAATDIVERLGQLLILVAIRNIALPIIFLAIALKASVPIVRGLMRISTTMNEDMRATLLAMDKALPSPMR